MNPLDAFPVTCKWPPSQPQYLQLYSLPTPNGVKVSIMLEEIALPYEAHRVSFEDNEQFSSEFLSLNPNNKIPVILDPNGPEGQPLTQTMITLYTWPTPNGKKIHIMLEECGLHYRAVPINISANEQFAPEFLKISPNNKIPAILDPNGPDGQPLALFESGAILLYLAEKSGQLLPAQAQQRYECIQWLMWQVGGVGPMFGQLGFFHKFAGSQYPDKRPRDRYVAEVVRLLGVLEQRLQQRRWLMGDTYSIADIAVLPWVNTLLGFYGAGELVDFARFANVRRVLDAFLARPAVQCGLQVPG